MIVEEEEEDEPVYIESSSEGTCDPTSWILIGKLWTNRPYNTFALMETMKKLWNPTRGMTCRELGQNMIAFQFRSKRDMERVLDMEPWHFNKHVLALKSIKEDIQPSMMAFNYVPFWIRVYDLPLMGRNEKTLKMIAGRIGEFIDLDKDSSIGLTRSVRIKVNLPMEKAMKRGIKVKIGEAKPCWLPITYERLPSFCYWCGMLGHTHKDCTNLHEKEDNGEEVKENEFPYGDWMRASPMKIVKVINEN